MAKINAKPLKVVVTGPESSGKTTLCENLAEHYNTSFIPEYAREYLMNTQGTYQKKDLVEIAKGQIKLEDRHLIEDFGLQICDTSLEVIRVWSEWKYKSCDPFVLNQLKIRQPDLYLLLLPDLPWQSDPLRENPHDREELFKRYQDVLTEYSVQCIEISGDTQSRLSRAVETIEANFY